MRLGLVPFLLLAALPAHAATPAAGAAPAPTARPASAADPASLLDQAREAQGRGDMELAVRLTQAAIVADPSLPSSYVALGDLYSLQGQVDYARTYYDAALQIDPADTAALRAEAALGSPRDTAANQ